MGTFLSECMEALRKELSLLERSKKPDLWMQAASERMERKGTKGALHRQLGVPEGERIPQRTLQVAARAPGLLGKRARFALRAREASR